MGQIQPKDQQQQMSASAGPGGTTRYIAPVWTKPPYLSVVIFPAGLCGASEPKLNGGGGGGGGGGGVNAGDGLGGVRRPRFVRGRKLELAKVCSSSPPSPCGPYTVSLMRCLLPFSSYRSEYRLRFQPFSQYEYVDGRFVQSQASLAVAAPERSAGGGGDEEAAAAGMAPARSLQGDPWFKEVVELRRRANDYRVREDAQST